VTFSTDLIYDVLRKYEPDHLLIEAAWADARARMTDVGRVADVLERAAREVRPCAARPGQPAGGAGAGR
jgi:ATP-dependent Lhr-like helicase